MFAPVGNHLEISDWFPVRIESAEGDGYLFVEWEIDPTGTGRVKDGGRNNTADDVAYPIDGSTFAADDIALARRAPGMGGVGWELMAMAGVPACCGWKADYWTDEWFPNSGGGFYSIHRVEAAGGVENEQWVVEETELNFDSTGIVDAVVRASIAATWTWDAIDGGDTNTYLIQVFAYLVTETGAFLSGPVPVLFGQTFVVGGTRLYTGDVGLFSRTAGELIRTFNGQGQATLRFGGASPFMTLPSRISWLIDVYTSRPTPGVNGIPGTLIVQGIGNGPTNITMEKLCCQTAEGSGSGSGSGDGCCEIDGDIEATIPVDVPSAGGATSATFAQAAPNTWTWNSAGSDAAEKLWTLTCTDGVYTLTDFNGNSADNTETLDCEAFALAFDATEFGGTGEITMVLA